MTTVTETMSPVVGRVRAYFAPVNRSSDTPTIFDPAQSGSFNLDAPPSPWVDLGWIDHFVRHCGSKVVPLRSGAPAATQMQVRTEIEATVTFAFESWGKAQMALAAGTQQMNLLAVASGAAAECSGGTAIPAVPLITGSTATVLQVGASAAAAFAVGELIAVDLDYAATTGFIGAGVSGAYLRTALTDVDYIRRITLNVARIAAIGTGSSAGSLTLEAPLLAGVPGSSMKVSSVVGFCDREGSSFFQEWSALFVGEGQQGERVVWHYPRLQTTAGISEDVSATLGGLAKARLAGSFRALPVVDPADGETVVCFRSYVTG